jgi:signal transduction histidine kinase
MTYKCFATKVGWIVLLLGYVVPQLQAANLDSLRTELAGLKPDTNGIKKAIEFTNLLRTEGVAEAEEFGKRTLELARQYNQPKWLADALMCNGSLYHYKSNYDLALKLQMEALELYRKVGEETGVARANVNIAAVYLNRENLDVAEKHLLEASEIVERLNIMRFKVTVNTNLAIIYTERHEFDKAMARNEASLAILKENEDLPKLVVAYSNIGYLYGEQNKHEEALFYYDKAYQTALQVGQMYYEGGFALQNKISTLVDLGRLQEAKQLLETLWPMVDLSQSERLRAESFQTEARLYDKLGDYKHAFSSLQSYHAIQDSLVTEDQNARFAEMEKAYDIAQRDAEIAKMEKESALLQQAHDLGTRQSKTQWILIVSLIIAVVLLLGGVVILVFLSLNRRTTLLELRYQHATIDAQNQEIELQNQALKAQNERLEDLNREKDGLVSIVAHDLKSPLNKSLGLLELIKMQGPLNEEQGRLVDMIVKVTSAGNDLIRDLLDLNAVEHPDAALHLEAIDLGQLWADLETTFSGEANRKALRLNWEREPECTTLYTDKKALHRILDNLVSNAMKFSQKQKEIYVKLAADGPHHLLLTVADQGPGIKEEDQRKLFKKFQRLSAQPTAGESSTGLGLAITKALVQKLSGEIWVKSQVGVGTTFFVRLPKQPQ